MRQTFLDLLSLAVGVGVGLAFLAGALAIIATPHTATINCAAPPASVLPPCASGGWTK